MTNVQRATLFKVRDVKDQGAEPYKVQTRDGSQLINS